MKNLVLALIILPIFIACTMIDPQGQMRGSEMTVARAKLESQDYEVILSGKIVKSLGEGLYIFQDATDSVKIVLTQKDLQGKQVSPGMRVKISGKVDQAITGVQIDVYDIESL